jgi:hypothetical protein
MKIACTTAMLALATIGTANVTGCLKGAVGGGVASRYAWTPRSRRGCRWLRSGKTLGEEARRNRLPSTKCHKFNETSRR